MRTNLNATSAFTPYRGPAGMFGLAADRRVFDAEDGSGGGAPGGNGETAEQKAAREAAEAAAKNKNTPPSDSEAKLLKELMAKKDEAANLKKSLDAVQAQLKTFEGIDPEKVKTLLAKEAELEAEKAKAEEEAAIKRGEFDRIRQQLVDQHNAALKAKEDEVNGVKGQVSELQKRINDLTIGSAFSGSTFVKDDLVLTPAKAQALYSEHFEIEDGRLVPYDKPRGAGERTPLVDGRGNPLPFDDAFKKIIEADPDHASLLRSKMRQGAGSDPGNGKTQQQQDIGAGRNRIAAALAAKAK
jgi:hypothetical protein